jgi:hypothetical protein
MANADHVSALRRLLNALPGKTGTVILPYLGSMGVFAVLSEAVARGRCSQDLVNQVTDPIRWFHELGVQRVIQVRPGAPPVGGELAPLPDLPPPEDVTPESTGDIFSSHVLGANGKSIKMKRRVRNGEACQSAIAPPGAVLGVGRQAGNGSTGGTCRTLIRFQHRYEKPFAVRRSVWWEFQSTAEGL